MEQQYLTVKQFAERAGVSTQRVYQLLTKSLQEFTKTEHGKKYISNLTAALLSSQEQHKALTDALTTAQALHAGTIQERLTAQVDSSEGQTEAMTADSDLDGGEPVQERQGFFARIFRKKGI